MARPKSQEKRNALLAAAIELIAEQGLSVPTSKIAHVAGVAEGTLFTYFETKERLLNDLYVELKLEEREEMMFFSRPWWILASLASVALFAPAQQPLTEGQKEFFENNIRPVLAQNCATCHNDTKAGGLRVMSREDLLKGGASGPALVPGDPDKSLLIAAVRRTNTALMMPKNGTPMNEVQIADLTKWVKEGAY